MPAMASKGQQKPTRGAPETTSARRLQRLCNGLSNMCTHCNSGPPSLSGALISFAMALIGAE